MTTVTAPALSTDKEKVQTDQRIDLNTRFLLAGIANPSLLQDIPRGVTLFLLPDNDPDFIEREIAIAGGAARRGEDVYLRHVRVADLPELPPTTLGPHPGDRSVSYASDGTITANLVFGEDGQWHETEEPPPGPREDEPWAEFTDRGDAPGTG